MSTAHFTPGPWVVGSGHQHAFRVYAGSLDGPIAANTNVEGGVATGLEAQANTSLIAAAPDLYAALEAVFDHLLFAFDRQETAIRIGRDSGNIHPGDLAIARRELHKFATRIDAARAALAKARGEVQP